jgi:hypothetical protein
MASKKQTVRTTDEDLKKELHKDISQKAIGKAADRAIATTAVKNAEKSTKTGPKPSKATRKVIDTID